MLPRALATLHGVGPAALPAFPGSPPWIPAPAPREIRRGLGTARPPPAKLSLALHAHRPGATPATRPPPPVGFAVARGRRISSLRFLTRTIRASTARFPLGAREHRFCGIPTPAIPDRWSGHARCQRHATAGLLFPAGGRRAPASTGWRIGRWPPAHPHAGTQDAAGFAATAPGAHSPPRPRSGRTEESLDRGGSAIRRSGPQQPQSGVRRCAPPIASLCYCLWVPAPRETRQQHARLRIPDRTCGQEMLRLAPPQPHTSGSLIPLRGRRSPLSTRCGPPLRADSGCPDPQLSRQAPLRSTACHASCLTGLPGAGPEDADFLSQGGLFFHQFLRMEKQPPL